MEDDFFFEEPNYSQEMLNLYDREMQKLIDSQIPSVPEPSGSAILSMLEGEIESSGLEETRMAVIPAAQPFRQERPQPLAVGLRPPDPPQPEESWRGLKEPMPRGFGKIGGGGAGIRHSEGIWCFDREQYISSRAEDCEAGCPHWRENECRYSEDWERDHSDE